MNQEKVSLLYVRCKAALQQHKYSILILLVGICMMFLPEKETKAVHMSDVNEMEQSLEEKMEQILQEVEGAGDVKVLLSQKTGSVCTYQENISVYTREDETERTTETVLVSADGMETAIPLQTIFPTYKGAVVLAEGADRPAVKLDLIRAVSSLTGLRSDQITVIKMKSN